MTELATSAFDDFELEPWKNGGGTTRELLRHPEVGELAWRVSLASIESDGAFSRFDGLDRSFVPISGAPFTLLHGDACPAAPQAPGRVHRFDGEWPTEAAGIQGRVEALNVLTRRGQWRATIEWLVQRPGRFALESEHSILLVFDGSITARVSGEDEPLALEARTALWLHEPDRGDELVLEAPDPEFRAALIELRSV
ncbi:MAG: HutD family protein [Planctomycetota bacterium]